MKLVVLGATGGIGIELVRQSIKRGDNVTALVRSAAVLAPFKNQIAVIRGDLLSCADLKRAIENHDAILSSFGPRIPITGKDEDLLTRFGVALTRAAATAGVRRVLVVSSAFLFEDAVLPPAHLVGKLFFRKLVADATVMEKTIEASSLDWTIVRPPRLTDGAHTAKYRTREGHLPRFGFRISRADVADFMLRTIGDPGSIGKIIGVAK